MELSGLEWNGVEFNLTELLLLHLSGIELG